MRAALALGLVLLLACTARGQDAPDAQKGMDAFLKTYWDPDRKVFKRTTAGGEADFWNQAHFMELLLDSYQSTGENRDVIDAFYEGFAGAHPAWTNDFNDDLGWWALALARAFEVTGEARFRDRSVALWQTIAAFEDPTYGGAVWWKRNGTDAQKNMATNAPFVMTAVKLAKITGDPRYLATGKRVYDWLSGHLVESDGHVSDGISGSGDGAVSRGAYTYNYGTWIGASTALFDATGDGTYLANARRAAGYLEANVARSGILPGEGDSDGAGFKGITTRYLAGLARHGDASVVPFLRANAQAAWDHRTGDGLMGPDWSQKASGDIEAFADASAVDTLFSAQVVAGPAPRTVPPSTLGDCLLEKGTAPGVATVEAASARLRGVSLENGAIAGWNQVGQSADFRVNVPADGSYAVVFRYAAGAGDATRTVRVNGREVARDLGFAGTGGWGEWRTVSIPAAELRAGDNTITVGHESWGAGGIAGFFGDRESNRNYLNLERIAVAPGQASAGVPVGPAVESRGFIEKLLGGK